MIDLTPYPALQALVARQLAVWPDHTTYLTRSFGHRSAAVLAVCDEIAILILKLASAAEGGLDAFCADYRYVCDEVVLPEELYFRRNRKYRLSTFEEANRECYANPAMMARYMNGLLLSTIFWDNHAHAFAYYANTYLPGLPEGAQHLEIGPGHGLQLYFAAARLRGADINGWDISATSIERTAEAMKAMTAAKSVALELKDIFAPKLASDIGRFDSIVLSEILEHLEDPLGALRHIFELLKPGGLVWVNVPVNSPAPDHIYLLSDPKEAGQLVADAGFEVVDCANYPMSNATLETARKHRLCVSCVVTGRRPA